MRILHLDTGTGWRGGQQQALWLMEGLRQRGQEQLLVAPAGSKLAEAVQENGLAVVPLSSDGVSFANVRAVRRLTPQFDILHAHDSRGHSLAWLAGIGQRRKTSPFLVVARRVAFPVGPFGGPKHAAADAYIAVSDYVREQLLKAKIPPAKIRVVYDGVKPPPPVTPGARIEFRRRWGLDNQSPLLGTLSPVAPEKLLKEMVALLECLPSSVHLWIGRPAAEQNQETAESALIAYGKQLGLEQRFRILPLSGDLGPFFGSLDIFLYLSRSEGLGSAILLAMAHGLPVVASAVGGIPEIVQHQKTGLLVLPDAENELISGVQLLLGSAELRHNFGAMGKEFVLNNATTDMMVSETFAVYEQLLKQKAHDGRMAEAHATDSSGNARRD